LGSRLGLKIDVDALEGFGKGVPAFHEDPRARPPAHAIIPLEDAHCPMPARRHNLEIIMALQPPVIDCGMPQVMKGEVLLGIACRSRPQTTLSGAG